MARSTENVVAELRRRYEDSDQPIASIAAEFEIGLRTLGRMALTEGWRKRSLRTRGLPIAVHLLAEAKALVVTLPPRSGGEGRRAEASRGGGSSDSQREMPPTPNPSPPLATLAEGGEQQRPAPSSSPSPIERLEALVVNEIDAEEAAYAQRRLGKHRVAKVSERNARTLATLTQTLRTIHCMRNGVSPEQEISDDNTFGDIRREDLPRDIDEFRRDLARRIDAFVASRTDAADAGGAAGPQTLDEAG